MQPMTERHAWSRRSLKVMQRRQDELQYPARRCVRRLCTPVDIAEHRQLKHYLCPGVGDQRSMMSKPEESASDVDKSQSLETHLCVVELLRHGYM